MVPFLVSLILVGSIKKCSWIISQTVFSCRVPCGNVTWQKPSTYNNFPALGVDNFTVLTVYWIVIMELFLQWFLHYKLNAQSVEMVSLLKLSAQRNKMFHLFFMFTDLQHVKVHLRRVMNPIFSTKMEKNWYGCSVSSS